MTRLQFTKFFCPTLGQQSEHLGGSLVNHMRRFRSLITGELDELTRVDGRPLEFVKIVSPGRYLRMRRLIGKTIKSVEVVPPTLGGGDFGALRVVLSSNSYSNING